MTSIITHSLAGLFIFTMASAIKKFPKRFWLICLLLPIIPDLDVIAFYFKIPYSSPFGHRGFTHSIVFSFVLSIILGYFLAKKETYKIKGLFSLIFFFTLISHTILDALTNGGLGVAFFWPFNNERYFFPWTPIQVSPIGVKAFISQRGLDVLLSEFKFVIAPLILMNLLILSARKVYYLTRK